MTYYNEYDPKAAAWLRELINRGLIPAGHVDERSISDVRPDEIAGFTQRHFFAGIGGWAYALRLAEWPDDEPVNTGSPPCQPFSNAGLQLGTKDARHLWPVFRDLITFGESTVTFGEQVASKLGREWLSGVRADLEGLGYAVGAADLCAAGVRAPHIRQRLFWVADPNGGKSGNGRVQRGWQHRQQPEDSCAGGLVHTEQPRLQRHTRHGDDGDQSRRLNQKAPRSAPAAGSAWDSFDLLACTDGKTRRIEPGSFPLAHWVSGRVGLLRGYGNSICPQLAAIFIRAFVAAKLNRAHP